MTQENLTQPEPEPGPAESSKPVFTVRCNGQYVGSAWLDSGRFGKYVKIVFDPGFVLSDKPVYVAPRKDAGQVFV